MIATIVSVGYQGRSVDDQQHDIHVLELLDDWGSPVGTILADG